MIAAAEHGALHGLLAALCLGLAAGIALSHGQILVAARSHNIEIRWSGPSSISRAWLKFAIPVFLGYSAVAPVVWVGQVLLFRLTDGYREVAIFNIALHWRNLIVVTPAALSQAATSLMSRFAGTKNRDASRRVFVLNTASSTIVALVAALSVAICSPLILSVYGHGYRTAVAAVTIGAFTAVPMAFNNALGATLAAAGKMWPGFAFNALWAVAVIVQGSILIPISGALGLTIAIGTSYLLHAVWQTVYVYRAGLVRVSEAA